MDGRDPDLRMKRSPARQLEHDASRWLLVAKGIGMLIGCGQTSPVAVSE